MAKNKIIRIKITEDDIKGFFVSMKNDPDFQKALQKFNEEEQQSTNKEETRKCVDCDFGCLIAVRYGVDFKTCKRFEKLTDGFNPTFNYTQDRIVFCKNSIDGMKVDEWFLMGRDKRQ